MEKKNQWVKLICLPFIAITVNLITSFTGFLSYYLNNVVGFGVVMAEVL